MAKFKENTLKVYNFIKAHEDENITAKDIASALGLDARQVNGIITGAFSRHKQEINGEKVDMPIAVREEGEIRTEQEDGSFKTSTAKFVRLTDFGRSFDPDSAE